MISINEATEQGLVEHYIFSSPSEVLETTQHGDGIYYRNYLFAEKERITAEGTRRAEVVQAANGQVALFVDNVANLN